MEDRKKAILIENALRDINDNMDDYADLLMLNWQKTVSDVLYGLRYYSGEIKEEYEEIQKQFLHGYNSSIESLAPEAVESLCTHLNKIKILLNRVN